MRVSIRRLKRRPEFLRVARGQHKSATPGLVLQAAPASVGQGAPECGLGFTVSRKVGGAVARNRARRRLRAAADAVMPAHAAPGRDYVVIGRAGTIRRPFDALKGDLEAALERLGCYRQCQAGGDGP
jgi:ribonuclease P protein component